MPDPLIPIEDPGSLLPLLPLEDPGSLLPLLPIEEVRCIARRSHSLQVPQLDGAFVLLIMAN